jgi:PD-(D/E)XK endonuclease
MASLKTKGDLAELKVATDLLERGYRVAIPYGEDHDFDLILCRGDKLERVQVKYSRSNGEVIAVKCYSHSLTNGRIRNTKRYTATTIDWLAVYDATTGRCFYIPAADLGTGKSVIHLRLQETKNCQRRGIRFADEYSEPEVRQLTNQPSASCSCRLSSKASIDPLRALSQAPSRQRR